MSELKAHPAADLFPMLSEARLRELADDIKANGLREPIRLFDGLILDGRNRYAACMLIDVKPATKTWSGGDPWAYVWSLNGERRDLGLEQRYLIWDEASAHSEAWQAEQQRISDEISKARSEAAKAKERDDAGAFAEPQVGQSGQPVESKPKAKKKAKTREAKAKASKTSASAVKRMDTLKKARPDLAELVRKGEMKPAEAMRQMKKAQVAEKVQALPPDKFRVIYADPPWAYGDTRQNLVGTTGAIHHYPSMTLAEICALPVGDMAADDAVLFLWATSPLIEQSFPVIGAWGFKYKACFVWDKVRHNLGHYNSVRHEFLMIATRGSCMPDSSELLDSVQTVEKAEHSHKPEHFREIIDQMYIHGPRIELFCRGSVPPNWQAWGNEADAA